MDEKALSDVIQEAIPNLLFGTDEDVVDETVVVLPDVSQATLTIERSYSAPAGREDVDLQFMVQHHPHVGQLNREFQSRLVRGLDMMMKYWGRCRNAFVAVVGENLVGRLDSQVIITVRSSTDSSSMVRTYKFLPEDHKDVLSQSNGHDPRLN